MVTTLVFPAVKCFILFIRDPAIHFFSVIHFNSANWSICILISVHVADVYCRIDVCECSARFPPSGRAFE